MKLVTAEQMRALEQKADQSGNTFAKMMERAGTAAAVGLRQELVARATRENRVLVLIGPGNNGGDGLVCARVLFDSGAPVTLYLWKRVPKNDDVNWKLCVDRGISFFRAEEDQGFAKLKELLAQHEVIVDALLGTGVARPIEGLLKDTLGVVRDHLQMPEESDVEPIVLRTTLTVPPRRLVVAVDLPSGLNPDTGALDPATLPADLTVTFAFPKIGQLLYPGAGAVGDLVVADIGIPEEWLGDIRIGVASARDVAPRLPERPQNSHKGTYGKAMICAGSIRYIGAAYLAGSAATRVGAGLVTLAVAKTIQPMIAPASHETTYLPLPDDEGALIPEAAAVLFDGMEDYDALLIGCGFGRDPKTIEFVQHIIQHGSTLPHLVIDADALYALSQTKEWWTLLTPGTAVLTPHPGEMATLSGEGIKRIQAERIEVAKEFAARWQQIVVLKGAHTVVAAPDGQVMLIPFATPALATAGTGDVLAGTIAGLLAQKLDPFDAAMVGAYIHGWAGSIEEEEIGKSGAVAGDLLPRLPVVMSALRGER